MSLLIILHPAVGVRPECRALSICRLLSVDRALSERPLLSNHRPSPRTQSNKRTWRRLSSAPLLILRCTIMMRTGPNSLFHPTRLSPKRRQFFRRRHLQLLLHKRLSCLHHHCRLHSQHSPLQYLHHYPLQCLQHNPLHLHHKRLTSHAVRNLTRRTETSPTPLNTTSFWPVSFPSPPRSTSILCILL